MFNIIAVTISALLAGLFGFAATRPNTFRVQRSTSIKAPPGRVFPFINDFHRWNSWSPFEKLDPGMKKTYSGAERGEGAVYEWDGNNKAGSGRMEITESSPPSKVLLKLEFTRPFKASNTTEFTLEPRGDATNVTWAIYGPNTYVGKLVSVFVSMDKMIGKDFEAGLASLKAVAEE